MPKLEIRRPRSDDRPLWDVFLALNGSIAVFAAHKLKMFSLLGERPRSLEQVCQALKIAPRPALRILEHRHWREAIGSSVPAFWRYQTMRPQPAADR